LAGPHLGNKTNTKMNLPKHSWILIQAKYRGENMENMEKIPTTQVNFNAKNARRCRDHYVFNSCLPLEVNMLKAISNEKTPKHIRV
jgi:hypothetical protein